jgi:hypothetical protein
MRDYHRRVYAALHALGATKIVFRPRRKHPRFHFIINGRPRFFVAAWSPSDRRSAIAAITTLRRIYGKSEEPQNPIPSRPMRKQP